MQGYPFGKAPPQRPANGKSPFYPPAVPPPPPLPWGVLRAVMSGDAAAVRDAVEAMPQQIDEPRDRSGWTPLTVAAANGNIEIVKILIEAGANPGLVPCVSGGRQWPTSGFNPPRDVVEYLAPLRLAFPIILAAARGNTAEVEKLLSTGETAERRAPNGTPVIEVAARSAKWNVVNLLLKNGASVDPLLELPGALPMISETLASAMRHEDLEKFRCRGGSLGSNSLVHLAVAQGCPETVDVLLKFEDNNAFIKSSDGLTPIEYALSSKCTPRIIKALYLHDPSAADAIDGVREQVLRAAVTHKDIELTMKVMDRGADVAALAKRPFLTTEAIWLAGRSMFSTQKHFFSDAAVKRMVESSKLTPAQLLRAFLDACLLGAAAAIVASGVALNNVQITPSSSQRLLFRTITRADASVTSIRYLVEWGADVASRDVSGANALHASLSARHEDIASYLLDQRQIDVNGARLHDAITPLHIAATESSLKMIERLISCGADLSARNKAGDTPLRLAVKAHRDDDVVDILRGAPVRERIVLRGAEPSEPSIVAFAAARTIKEALRAINDSAACFALLTSHIPQLETAEDSKRQLARALQTVAVLDSDIDPVLTQVEETIASTRDLGIETSERDASRALMKTWAPRELDSVRSALNTATLAIGDTFWSLGGGRAEQPKAAQFLGDFTSSCHERLRRVLEDAPRTFETLASYLLPSAAAIPDDRELGRAVGAVMTLERSFHSTISDFIATFPHADFDHLLSERRRATQDAATALQAANARFQAALTHTVRFEQFDASLTSAAVHQRCESLVALKSEIATIEKKCSALRALIDSDIADPDIHPPLLEKLSAQLATKRPQLRAELRATFNLASEFFPEHVALLCTAFVAPAAPAFDPAARFESYTVDDVQGDVSFCRDGSGTSVVVKRCRNLGAFERECNALQHVRHPFVIDVISTFADEKYFYIVTPRLTGGSLNEWIAKRVELPFSAAMAIRMFSQSAEGLAALHAAGIVHGDVSPKNLLASSELDDALPKIIDFDVSTDIAERAKLFAATTQNLLSISGTRGYVAPEVQRLLSGGVKAPAQISEVMRPPIDVYALAVVMCEALGVHRGPPLSLPRRGCNEETTSRLLQDLEPSRWKMEELLRSMLNEDPDRRPTAIDVARSLSVVFASLTEEVERARQAALTVTGCCICLKVLPASQTAQCGEGHSYCAECFSHQAEVWSREPLARHQTKRGAMFCLYGKCGAVFSSVQIARVAGDASDAIERAKELVLRQLADAAAIYDFKARAECESPAQRAMRHIDEEILAFRCPDCAAFVGIDFNECLALTCPSCDTHFCGWCRAACDSSAATHAHLAAHTDMPRHLDEDLWMQRWLKLRAKDLRDYTSTLPQSVADEIYRKLRWK